MNWIGSVYPIRIPVSQVVASLGLRYSARQVVGFFPGLIATLTRTGTANNFRYQAGKETDYSSHLPGSLPDGGRAEACRHLLDGSQAANKNKKASEKPEQCKPVSAQVAAPSAAW
jgi:hypothetical protein